MLSTSSDPSCQPRRGIHPLLRGLAIDSRAVAVRMLAYFSGLAMLALIAADLMAQVMQDQPPAEAAATPPPVYFHNKSIDYRTYQPPATRPVTQARTAAADWLTEAAPPRLRGRL